MFGEVVAEGDTIGEVTLAAALARPEVMTVVIRPGDSIEDTLAQAVDDLTSGEGGEDDPA